MRYIDAMNPDREICCKSVSSRDGRFDGGHSVVVASTGIYCRPVGPM